MIDITENAIKRIKDISTKQESNLFRISVDGGGCQGFSYKFSFDKIKRSDDLQIKFDEITVLIDRDSGDIFYLVKVRILVIRIHSSANVLIPFIY